MSKKRSIFEDVSGSGRSEPSAATDVIEKDTGSDRALIRLWLAGLFVLVLLLIVVGGLTRLTDSGLSITEWNVVTGILPPLNSADWSTEFQKYQGICEFTEINATMTLAEFKTIYWWEWGHRQLARIVGLVWAIGFVGFWIARRIPAGWLGRLFLLGALGGLQGAIGWWMVASGVFQCRVDVSSVRLAVHLGLAFVILGAISWYWLRLSRSRSEAFSARRMGDMALVRWTTVLGGVVFLQVVIGALVAGIDAGRSYTDWPLMAGAIFPPDPFQLTPWYLNFVEDPGLVQFCHRLVGYMVLILAFVIWLRSRSSGNLSVRFALNAVMAVCLLQVILGVLAVIYAAPMGIALIHQLGAAMLWALVIRARYLVAYPQEQSVSA